MDKTGINPKGQGVMSGMFQQAVIAGLPPHVKAKADGIPGIISMSYSCRKNDMNPLALLGFLCEFVIKYVLIFIF